MIKTVIANKKVWYSKAELSKPLNKHKAAPHRPGVAPVKRYDKPKAKSNGTTTTTHD